MATFIFTKRKALFNTAITSVIVASVFFAVEYLKENMRKGEIYSSFGRYEHPWNSSLTGLEFKFTETTLKLVQHLTEGLKYGQTIDDISVASYSKHLKPVTAVSSNHFLEIMAHLNIVEKFMPNVTVVVYDLGLKQDQVKALQEISYVEYRKFDFPSYPKFVRKLKIYAWKILVIQRILAEFGGALWLDASIVFQNQIDQMVLYMVEKRSSFLYYIYLAGHTIVAATEPRMFDYLPMKSKHLAQDMPQSGAMLIFNTEIVRSKIMKWAIACALLEQCIAPPGSHLHGPHCDKNFPVSTFGGCHRYDQSLFAITVSNAYDLQYEKYSLPKHMQYFAYPRRVRTDWFLFEREAIPYYVIFFVIVGFIMLIIILRWKRIKRQRGH